MAPSKTKISKSRLSVSQIKFSLDDLKDYLRKQNIIDTEADYKRCWCLTQKSVDVFRVIRIRALMTLSIVSLTVFLVCTLGNFAYLACLSTILVIWAETLYICVKHEAKDFYW